MGDWFNTIALYAIILNLTGSGRDVGLLLVARFPPSFLFGPLSGVVADRFSRRTIMIVSDVLRALVVLGFLFVRRADQLWLIYVLTVLQLGLSTFFEPAKTAAIPSIVEDRELVARECDLIRHLVGDAHFGRRNRWSYHWLVRDRRRFHSRRIDVTCCLLC